jgi:hypothetical protein
MLCVCGFPLAASASAFDNPNSGNSWTWCLCHRPVYKPPSMWELPCDQSLHHLPCAEMALSSSTARASLDPTPSHRGLPSGRRGEDTATQCDPRQSFSLLSPLMSEYLHECGRREAGGVQKVVVGEAYKVEEGVVQPQDHTQWISNIQQKDLHQCMCTPGSTNHILFGWPLGGTPHPLEYDAHVLGIKHHACGAQVQGAGGVTHQPIPATMIRSTREL